MPAPRAGRAQTAQAQATRGWAGGHTAPDLARGVIRAWDLVHLPRVQADTRAWVPGVIRGWDTVLMTRGPAGSPALGRMAPASVHTGQAPARMGPEDTRAITCGHCPHSTD